MRLSDGDARDAPRARLSARPRDRLSSPRTWRRVYPLFPDRGDRYDAAPCRATGNGRTPSTSRTILLAPEEDLDRDPRDTEPEPTRFDDEPDEHETVPLHSEDVLDDEAEPPPSDLSDDSGLLDPEGLQEPGGEDEDESVADEVSLSRELDPDPDAARYRRRSGR